MSGPLQGNSWQQLTPSGTAPSARSGHSAAWSDVAAGMYIFGGYAAGPCVMPSMMRFAPRQQE